MDLVLIDAFRIWCVVWLVAEGVGFEPTVACTTPVFKTGLFDHSSTPPNYSESTTCGILVGLTLIPIVAITPIARQHVLFETR